MGEIIKRMKNVTYAGGPQHGGMGAIAAPQPGFHYDTFKHKISAHMKPFQALWTWQEGRCDVHGTLCF